MPFSTFRVHKHKPNVRQIQENVVEELQKRAACQAYVAPKNGDTVDVLKPTTVTWDPSCITDKAIDIWVYSPYDDSSRLHYWQGVATKRGSYNVQLIPSWWNNTATKNLQFNFASPGELPMFSNYTSGPIFTATYTAPADGSTPAVFVNAAAPFTPVNDLANQGMTPGKKAAAALLPILFILLCIGAFIKVKRNREQKKRNKFKEGIDKRMSTISGDWKSISAAGATAAIRNSMAVGNRNSAFNFGGIRPTSTFAVEGGGNKEEDGSMTRPMSQMRTGVGLRNPAGLSNSTERVSRVSFAPDTRVSRASVADSRPSGESRRTRAFHDGQVPPVPSIPDVVDKDITDTNQDGDEGSFSPRQAQGALTLTPEDIRARIAKNKARNEATPSPVPGIDDVLPALSMMRAGNEHHANGADDDDDDDDYLFPQPPQPPATAYPKSVSSPPPTMSSPIMSSMPMQPMPANVMSPDEMLRAYAERKKSMHGGNTSLSLGGGGGGAAKPISYPMPAHTHTQTTSSGGGGGTHMRALYDAATGVVVSPTHTGGRKSEDEAYDYNDSYSAYAEYGSAVGPPPQSAWTTHMDTDTSLVPDVPPTNSMIAPSEYSDYSTGGVYTATPYGGGGYHPNAHMRGVSQSATYVVGEVDEEDVHGHGQGLGKHGYGA